MTEPLSARCSCAEIRKAAQGALDHIRTMHAVAEKRGLPDYIVADLNALAYELSFALDQERPNG